MKLLEPVFVTLSLSLGALAFGACDLPQKDIGKESASAGDSNGGGQCQPGDEMPAEDGCNDCVCGDDGYWGCTQRGCDPGDTGPDPGTGTECMDGQTKIADDGCNTCGCLDGYWACTLLGCPDTDGGPPGTGGDTDGDGPIPFDGQTNICGAEVPFDALVINTAEIVGDQLEVNLSYSGGCAMHLFGSCWDGSFLESNPVQVQLRIAHDSMMDACKAFPTEDRSFDLSALAAAYEDGYQTDGGTIMISLEGYVGSLEYTF